MNPLVSSAHLVATAIHCNQKYGDKDYSEHLKSVVHTLQNVFLCNDPFILAAAWLHDSIEDQNLKLSYIKKYFGDDIADIVYRVTDERGRNRSERHKKTYLKIAGHFQATMVKLADRYANVLNSIETENTEIYSMYSKEQDEFLKLLGINSTLNIAKNNLTKHNLTTHWTDYEMNIVFESVIKLKRLFKDK